MRNALLLLVTLAGAGLAQVQPGDFLIADGAFPSRLIAVQPGTSMVTPIAGFTGGFAAEALMARNNRDYLVALAGNPSAILHVSTTGQISTIFSGAPLGAMGMCTELYRGETACIDGAYSTPCTTSDDCPVAPSGRHGTCLDEAVGLSPTDARYHRCWAPYDVATNEASCW